MEWQDFIMVIFGMLPEDGNEIDWSYEIIFLQDVIEKTRMLQSGKELEESEYCEHKGLCREAEWEMNVYFPFQ